jgi:hypothetical protein
MYRQHWECLPSLLKSRLASGFVYPVAERSVSVRFWHVGYESGSAKIDAEQFNN